jgi:glycine oxidase
MARYPLSPFGTKHRTADIVIAGAGVIGLSLALELHGRGGRVTVLERDIALGHASTAAAGMLAAEDPHNPPALLPLSRYSLSLYASYLQRIEELSGMAVPFQTETTWQYLADASRQRFAEQSIDPRQLATALRTAVQAAGIELQERVGFPQNDTSLATRRLVIAGGAWSSTMNPQGFGMPVVPRKGQMLRVKVPDGAKLTEVHRSEKVYVVPRSTGPQAGTALIGATVEDVGFDISTDADDLAMLRSWAAELVPELGSADVAPMLEAWAGLRPTTPDHLPVLGQIEATFIATGHFRNGILLAPATAVAVADLIEGKKSAVDLKVFAPGRFLTTPDSSA